MWSLSCAHEIVAASHHSNLDVVFLELDFKKAFDFVSWDFLLALLQAKGYGPQGIGWIKSCLTSRTSSILVDSQPESYINCRKGLRKGIPSHPTFSSS